MIRFCDNCLNNVKCTYKEHDAKVVIDGIEVSYLKKYYVCNICGEEFFDDLADYNIKEANNKLKNITRLITVDEIEEILNKYSIGKKPLSLILNMGEVTISRYCVSGNPSKENSDLLKAINKSPFLLEIYLKANKEKISDVAYKKTLGKISQISLSQENSKLYQCCLYILSKLKDLSPLSLQKLLYFIDGFYYSYFKNRIFNYPAQAWPFGPVYTDIYDCFSYYKRDNIDFNEIFKDTLVCLAEDEKRIVDDVINSFGCYSGGMLIDMTHLTLPWINARAGLEPKDRSCVEIEYSDMNMYFDQVLDKYKNIEEYARALFEQVKNNKTED